MDVLALRFIKSCLSGVTDAEYDSAKITPDLFVGTEAREAVEWVKAYQVSNSAWPAELAVESTIGEALPTVAEPFDFVVSQLKERYLGASVAQGLQAAASLLDRRKPQDALAALQRVVDAAPPVVKPVGSFKETALDRVTAYEVIKAGGGPVTLPYPWPTLNRETQGLVDGTLNVVVAPPNTGKTWFCCIVANHYLGLGHKILLVSLEMASPRIFTRLDSLKYKLSFGHLRNAALPLADEVRWKAEAATDVTSLIGDIVLADKEQCRTVQDTMALVSQHKPRLVVVDGGYRYEGVGRFNSGWEQSSKIVGDLQACAEKSGIPWLVTTQYALEDTTKLPKGTGHPMKMAGVKYAREWVINPDVVIGMYASPFNRSAQQMTLVLLKVRDHSGEASDDAVTINWNATNGDYSEVPMTSFAPAEATVAPDAGDKVLEELLLGIGAPL